MAAATASSSAAHEQLKAQMEEWNKKMQSLEVAGGVPQDSLDSLKAVSSKEKEEAACEVARALEKLLLLYGENA